MAGPAGLERCEENCPYFFYTIVKSYIESDINKAVYKLMYDVKKLRVRFFFSASLNFIGRFKAAKRKYYCQ